MKKYIPYVIILFVTIIICIPLFTMNLNLNNEAILHMSRVIAVDEVIKDGIFPPIINYRFMNGTGYALNLFYGPLTTYVPIILLNIFKTAGMALKTFTVITVLLSAIMMYKFTFAVTKRKSIATISAIIYISAPYKLSNIYSRNAVGEYTAFIFIPIVFESLYNLINNNKKKKWLLSVGIIGLVLSHTITTIYIAIFSIIYLSLNIKKLKNVNLWKTISINIIISFLVCSFYVFPLLEHTFETDYTIYNKYAMGTTSESVSNTALEIKELFKSEIGNQEIRFSIGIVVILLSILIIFCIKKIDEKYKKVYYDFIILSLITLVMSTKIFPWKYLPDTLGVIQFAWRNIGFFAFFISFICGINSVTFAEKILNNRILRESFLFGVICSVCVFSFLGIFRNYRFDDLSKEKDLDIRIKTTNRIYAYSINREYLPLKAVANLKDIQNREDRAYIISGRADVIKEEKLKLDYSINLANVEDKTELELPYLYYLGYTIDAEYDNKTIELKISESNNGLLQVTLPKAESIKLILKYEGTTLTKAGYFISILGVIFLTIYVWKGRVNEEKNIKI